MNQRLADIRLLSERDDVDNLLCEEIRYVSEKAVLCLMQDGSEKWFPKSQLRIDEDEILYVTTWFLRKEESNV